MSAVHYNGFDVVRIDADGLRIALPNEDLNAEIVGGASLGTVTTDEFGNVPSSTFPTGDAGDIVEFSHDTYPGTFRRTTAISLAECQANPENFKSTFVVEDLDHVEAVSVPLWVRDLTSPETVDVFLGNGIPGTTNKFPFPSFGDKILKIFSNPVMETGLSLHLRYEDGQSVTVDAASAGPDEEAIIAAGVMPLFESYADVPSTTTGADLNASVIPEDILFAGHKIKAQYEGKTAANGNSKTWAVIVGGETIATFTNTLNNGGWSLTVMIVCESTANMRSVCHFAGEGLSNAVQRHKWTSYDTTAPAFMVLRGTTATANADITLESCEGHKIGKSNVPTYVIYDGDFVTFEGEYVTFGG